MKLVLRYDKSTSIARASTKEKMAKRLPGQKNKYYVQKIYSGNYPTGIMT